MEETIHKQDVMKELENIVETYQDAYQEYNNFLIDLANKQEQLNHVKNIKDINTILFNNDVDIDRIQITNIELLKNKCLIDDCKKIVCYQLNFTKNNKNNKFICWHHLCNLIQNFQ